MTRAVLLYIDEVLESIELISQYVANMGEEEFQRQPIVQDAVIRRLGIIGEAVRHFPNDLTSQFPSIPWKEIAAMRNVLIHVYFGVKLNRVWLVLKDDLAPLRQALSEMRGKCSEGSTE